MGSGTNTNLGDDEEEEEITLFIPFNFVGEFDAYFLSGNGETSSIMIFGESTTISDLPMTYVVYGPGLRMFDISGNTYSYTYQVSEDENIVTLTFHPESSSPNVDPIIKLVRR